MFREPRKVLTVQVTTCVIYYHIIMALTVNCVCFINSPHYKLHDNNTIQSRMTVVQTSDN